MKLNELWHFTYPSICSITFLNSDNQRMSSGSGFRIGDYLVTNNHVVQVHSAAYVALRFVQADGNTIAAQKTFRFAEFKQRLLAGDTEANWDYAIYDLRQREFQNIPPLQLCSDDDLYIGTEIAILGFQFEQANLSIHSGTLSSKFSRAKVDYLQLDASVNSGNSGGPLIEVSTGKVAGIVTRKATGLTEQFRHLIGSFDHNLQIFSAVQGGITLGGVSLMEALKATQIQMRGVAVEIERSANVGIGYAYSLKELRKAIELL